MKSAIFKLFLVGGVSLFCSLLLTPYVARLLTWMGVVDKPSERRINKKPIPRGGGIAPIAAFFAALAVALGVLGIDIGIDAETRATLAGAVVALAFVGAIDDVFGLKPLLKLLGQIAVALIVYSAGISLRNILIFSVPDWLDCIVTVGWIVVIVNAFNLVDGLDGLASGLAAIGAFGLSVCFVARGKPASAVILAALIGACLGFLRYNFNPASVFLGDTGSMFLGLVLAVVPLVYGGKAAFLASVGVPLLVVGVPLFDTILAIVRRGVKAQLSKSGRLSQIFLPDMEHLHHRLLASGSSQRGVAMALYSVAAVMVAVAIAVALMGDRSSGAVFLGAIVVIALLSRQLSKVELWYTGNLIMRAFGPKFLRMLGVLYIVCDVLIALSAWWAAGDLAMIPHISARGLRYTVTFPFFFVAIFASMWCFQIYRRVWADPMLRDYMALFGSIVLGWTVAYSLAVMTVGRYPGFWRHATIFLLIILPLMLAERIVRIMLNSFLSLAEGARTKNDEDVVRVIVYGAGERYRMIDIMQAGSLLDHQGFYVAGIVDDDPAIIRHYVHGRRVERGSHLESAVIETRSSAIMIAADLDETKLGNVLAVAEKHGLAVFRFANVTTRIFDKEKGRQETPVAVEKKRK